jgi:hypothetical protein
VQDVLERPLVLENPSSYVQFRDTTMPEWEFVRRLCDDADCGLLLDVNNVYVASVNHGFDPQTYLDAMPWDRVAQFHLAGHTTRATHLFDSHIGPVTEPVWALYREAWRRTGGRATLYEWDDEIPAFDTLLAQAVQARDRVADLPIVAPVPVPIASVQEARPPLEPPLVVTALLRWMQAEVVMGQGTSGQPADAHLLPNERMTADDRVDIHRSMYRVRTAEALRTDFPRTARLLGPRFDRLVADYRHAHRSTSYALELFGKDFAHHVAGQVFRPGWAGDLTRLEWLAVQAWLAPQAQPLDLTTLAAIAPEDQERLVLTFAPSLQLSGPLRVQAWNFAHDLPPPASKARRPVAVWAFRGEPKSRLLTATEARLIQALQTGRTLAEALDLAGRTSRLAPRQLALHVGGWFQAWAQDGMVCGAALAPGPT